MALFNKKKEEEKKKEEKKPKEEKKKEEETATTKEIAEEVFNMLPTAEARTEFEYFYNECKRLNTLNEDLEKLKAMQE